MDSITIKPGGKIISRTWKRKKKKGKWVKEDITDKTLYHLLWPPCKIGKGVTLHDIFLILERDLSFYKVLINSWVDEIVAEGLTPCDLPSDPNIKYVEVYWHVSYDKDDNDDNELYSDILFPQFHGVSARKDGVPYSLMYTPANRLADKPIKIGKAAIGPDFGKPDTWLNFDKSSMSLLQILYAVVFELSWSGSPKMRDKKKTELDKVCDKVKKGQQ